MRNDGLQGHLYLLADIESGVEVMPVKQPSCAESYRPVEALWTDVGYSKEDDRRNSRETGATTTGQCLAGTRIAPSWVEFLDGGDRGRRLGLSWSAEWLMNRTSSLAKSDRSPMSGLLLFSLPVMMLLCISCEKQTEGAEVNRSSALAVDAGESRQELLEVEATAHGFVGEDQQEYPDAEPVVSNGGGGNHHELPEVETVLLEVDDQGHQEPHEEGPETLNIDGTDSALVGVWRKIVLGDDPADPVYRLAVFPQVPASGTSFAVYDYDADRVICCMRVDGAGLSFDQLLDDLKLPMSRALEVLNVLWRGDPGYSSKAVKLVVESDFSSYESEDWERKFGGDTWNFSVARDGILVPKGSRLVAPRAISIGGQRYDVIWSPEWIGDYDGLMDAYIFRPQSGGKDRRVGIAHNDVH